MKTTTSVKPTVARSSIRGIGDVIAAVAQPTARLLDAVFKTDFKNCKRCPKTQEKLNKAVPFK